MNAILVNAIILLPSLANADTESALLRSVEWLTDSSDMVLLVRGTPDAYTIQALLKGSSVAPESFAAGKQLPRSSVNDGSPPPFRPYSIRAHSRPPDHEDEILFFRKAFDGRFYLAANLSLANPYVIMPSNKVQIRFFAVDRFGHPITDADALLAKVRHRVAHGSIIPFSSDRELAESPTRLRPLDRQPFGATWISSDELSVGDYAFSICVPDHSDIEPQSLAPKAEGN